MTGFANAPKEVLQRIFIIGVTEQWIKPEELQSDSSVMDSEDEEAAEHEVFAKDHDPWKKSPELKTIMDCAMVCRNWANSILDKDFWNQARLPRSHTELPEPWQMGKAWNHFFRDVPCRIACTENRLLHNIGAIDEAIRRGRTRFIVYLPANKKRQRNVHQAWQVLSRRLCKRSTSLELVSRTGSPVGNEFQLGLLDVIAVKWAQLKYLSLDSLYGSPWNYNSGVWHKLMNAKPEEVRKDAPLPSLKEISFPTHPNDHLAREVLNIAPNIEMCDMDTSGFKRDPVPGWDMHRNCISHTLFLEDEKKFRTFVTPFVMLAFKWPGPKRLEGGQLFWKLMSSRSHTPDFVSERRNGHRCELRMSIDEFFNVEDLTKLEIPRSEST